MPKLARGRLDGVSGMAQFTAAELHQIADNYQTQLDDPSSIDDEKWLQRRVTKIRKLAEQKEKSIEHKQSQ